MFWATLRRFVFGPRPKLVAVYSDGKREPVGFFASWFARDRPPHLLLRLESDGYIVWTRKGFGQ